MNVEKIEQIPGLIREIYSLTDRLTQLFPNRPFTPDGHLVGSIGEVLAAYHYELELFTASTEGHDARTGDGILVQIKATQRKSVALRSKPEHLLVLQIQPNGEAVEVFNGPGELAWSHVGKPQNNGQRQIAVSTLLRLMKDVQASERLPRVI